MINTHDNGNYYNSISLVVNDSYGVFLEIASLKEEGAMELSKKIESIRV
jgi:hypothetical protein